MPLATYTSNTDCIGQMLHQHWAAPAASASRSFVSVATAYHTSVYLLSRMAGEMIGLTFIEPIDYLKPRRNGATLGMGVAAPQPSHFHAQPAAHRTVWNHNEPCSILRPRFRHTRMHLSPEVVAAWEHLDGRYSFNRAVGGVVVDRRRSHH